jgi:hypothetical protein
MPGIPQASQSSQVAGSPPITYPSGPSTPATPFTYGSVELHPDLSYDVSYETGLQSAPGKTSDSTIQTLSAAMIIQGGTVWNLSYTPKWVLYSSTLFKDAFDQDARLGANFSYQDWDVQVSQSYDKTSDPLVETGRQTAQQSYGTAIKGLYGGGLAQPSIEVAFDQSVRFASLAPTVYDWNSQDWVHFPISPQWDVAVGPGGGFTHEDPGFDMVYARPEAQLIWQPGQKFSLNAQGGIQETEFLVTPRSRNDTAIFSTNLVYRPWETTTATIGMNRQVSPSYEADQIGESTMATIALEQRLLGHFFISLEAGTGKTDYLSASQAASTVRGDTTDSLQASLSTVLFSRLNLELSLSRLRNSSDIKGYGFTTYQYGFDVSLKF